jgi:hypothetical protein
METLQIRFIRGTGWDSKVIEWDTRCWTSHVELVSIFMTFGAQLKGGVKWRSVLDPCYKNVDWIEVFEIQITDLQHERLQKIMEETDGLPYDWRAIVSFGLGQRDWREPDSWFCSEFVCMVLEQLCILLDLGVDLPVWRITPRDAYMLLKEKSNFKLVYQSTSVKPSLKK